MGLFICPYCGEQFDEPTRYALHLKSVHPEEPPIEPIVNEYEWYVDPEKGYWSPMLREWGITPIKSEAEKEKEVIKTGIGAVPAVPEEVKTAMAAVGEVDDLLAHYNAKTGFAFRVDAYSAVIYAATSIIAALPFTRVADAIDEIWRIPIIASSVEMARDIHLASYSLTQKPLIARYLLSKTTPYVPEDYRLALAVSRGILTDEKYTKAMAERGLNSDWADMWKEENYNYPSVEMGLRLLRRGDINTEAFNLWMTRLAMPKSAYDEVIKLKEVIPPLPDLIRFAVREAFGEHTYEEQYPAYESFATKMGLTKEAAGWYWWSHWIRISLSQMYDNLWRGYWDEEKFKSMLRLVDIHPDDRDDIYNVAFSPPTVRELGYGYDVGAYTREDIKKYRRWGGLSEEDATKASDALVDYRLEAEREALRREWMYLFSLGKMSEEEFRANLEAVFEMGDRTDLWVERGKYHAERLKKGEVPLEYRVVTSSEAKWMFVNNLRDEAWYRAKLADLEWTDERIDVAVERALEEMKPPEVEEVPPTYRNLTVTQIKDLYGLEKITAAEVPAFLEFIGYSPTDAEMLAQSLIYEEEVPPPTRALTRTDIERAYDLGLIEDKDLIDAYIAFGYSREDAAFLALYTRVNVWYPDLKKLYSNGWITENEMYSALLDLGLPKERADVLMMLTVKFEAPARTASERDLTKSEILKGAKKDILTVTQAASLLMDLGYDEGEAAYLLVLNDVVVAGDPESFWEMKRVTEAYKKSLGKPAKVIPDQLLLLEQQVRQLRAEIEKMKEEEATEEELGERLITLNELEGRYRKLIVEWERQ